MKNGIPFKRWKSAPCGLIGVAGFFMFASLGFADKMRIVDDPITAAQIRVDLLQQAKRSIKAQYFIIGSDPLTYSGLALARDAAWRGCDVRIIVDANFNGLPPSVSGYLLTQGVQIKVYHPFSFAHLNWFTRRMHDKGLSVDGEKMIRGGRNVQDSYFGRAVTNFIDRDAYLEGRVVRDSEAYFDKLWNSDQVAWVKGASLTAQRYEEGRRLIDDAREKTARSKKWKMNTSNKWGRGLPDVGAIRFLHDPVGKKDVEPGIAESLRDIVRRGHKTILMESPYLVPTPELYREIRSAQARGVGRVEMITNSMRSNDGLYAQAGYEAAKGELLKSGVDLWEFIGPHTLHAKSAVIDGRWAIIGSFNLDPRSQRLNTETAVTVENRQLAAELTRAINVHKVISWHIGPDGWPVEDSVGYPAAPWSRRIKVTLLRMALPLFWKQL